MEGRSGYGTQQANDQDVDNKQERRTMESKGVEGIPADPQESVAANEEFGEQVDGYASVTQSPAGWDPYEVWRTRVKGPSKTKEREADPRS
jgi:hypothetical protein